MKKAGEDKKFRNQLRGEMEPVKFSEEMQAAVLRRVQAPSPSWWNREIRIPASAAAAVVLLIIAVPLYGWQQARSMQENMSADSLTKGEQQEERIIVSTAGVFYASQLEGENR
jgi:hypothetical protein